MSSRKAFSLPELLTVIAVIAVLVGIMLPVVGKARSASKRVACRAQLSDILKNRRAERGLPVDGRPIGITFIRNR